MQDEERCLFGLEFSDENINILCVKTSRQPKPFFNIFPLTNEWHMGLCRSSNFYYISEYHFLSIHACGASAVGSSPSEFFWSRWAANFIFSHNIPKNRKTTPLTYSLRIRFCYMPTHYY